MLDREAVLEAPHPQPRLAKVRIVAAECGHFRDTQPMTVPHQHQQVIADAVSPLLGRVEQATPLAVVEGVLGALVAICCRRRRGLLGPHTLDRMRILTKAPTCLRARSLVGSLTLG